MRKEFATWIEAHGRAEQRFLFLTGDLGFMALENVQAALGPRFINAGVCEQNMVSVAAGLARQGLLPLCYSIAPFAVFRPYEQIRLDVAIHGLDVKVVGNGGGYGYGIMGASHHALEDLAVLSALPNFRCIVPLCNEDVAGACASLFGRPEPGYLRLGFGLWPKGCAPLPGFEPIRQLVAAAAPRAAVTVLGIGPVVLNLLPWLADTDTADLFAISELPLADLTPELVESVRRTGVLWTVEEHSARGGMGEHLAAQCARRGITFRLHQSHARGYPDGRYGSQSFHQKQSGLDRQGLEATLRELVG